MEHARQWFVDLSRFIMGGSTAACDQRDTWRGRESMGSRTPCFQCWILECWKPLDGGPITVVLLFEFIVFYFSILLSVLLFCHLLRKAPLP